MSTENGLTLRERQLRVLERLDQGHIALKASLEGIDPEDAFLGSRWSVWEVLKHLDSEGFVDALEHISRGDSDVLPDFNGRAQKLESDIGHLEDTFEKFKAMVAGIPEDKLDQPVTPPNPDNSYPGLTFLELVERVSGHEAAHARQIVETRKYIQAFSARERAINFVTITKDSEVRLGTATIGLLKHADYVVGSPETLEKIHNYVGGVPLTLYEHNIQEILSRLERETKAGLWTVVCTLGEPIIFGVNLVQEARKNDSTVTIRSGSD
ncbi:MAG: hypothetical protein CL753_00355 [Chloroflexi bacterium]|nr:hypothetical protein [Chloroflexota bacterium]